MKPDPSKTQITCRGPLRCEASRLASKPRAGPGFHDKICNLSVGRRLGSSDFKAGPGDRARLKNDGGRQTSPATGCSPVALATPMSQGACNPAEATLHCLELHPRNGGTPGCNACTIDSTHHNKQCVERFQKIFDKEDAEAAAAVARPGAEISATSEEQASASSGDAPPVVSPEAAEATTAFIPAENETLACGAGSLPMERMGGPGIAQQTPSAAPIAFLHSRMDEVVFVHTPKADHLVKLGFC